MNEEFFNKKPGCKKVRNIKYKNPPKINPIKLKNIKIYEKTKNLCDDITVSSSILIDYEYNFEWNTGLQIINKIPYYNIENIDTLVMAQNYINNGLNPLVLNMASMYKPGGGVLNGKFAQEEEIFRRTTAYLSHNIEYYGNELDYFECIYSPEVILLRDVDNNILSENERITFSMLAVPAIKNPAKRNGLYRYEWQKHIMKQKIESIFQVALKYKHDSLILGALGCGAYKNPVKEVAEMFKEMCDKYGCYFEKIGFAILSKNDRDEQNIRTFVKVLSG